MGNILVSKSVGNKICNINKGSPQKDEKEQNESKKGLKEYLREL